MLDTMFEGIYYSCNCIDPYAFEDAKNIYSRFELPMIYLAYLQYAERLKYLSQYSKVIQNKTELLQDSYYSLNGILHVGIAENGYGIINKTIENMISNNTISQDKNSTTDTATEREVDDETAIATSAWETNVE